METTRNTKTVQGIPAFRDFTIRDPRYFVIFFGPYFMILKKNICRIFFSEFSLKQQLEEIH